jgi:hypothetical protein
MSRGSRTKEEAAMRRSIRATVVALVLTIMASAQALAATPTINTYAIDSTFVPPTLSRTCGFDVTRHVFGTLSIKTFVDTRGQFVREIDSYHLTETITANGITLTGRTVQQIFVDLLRNGGYTVTVVGSDFLLTLAGSGYSFGAVGRLVLVFDSNDQLVDVTQDVGGARSNYLAICAALTLVS